MVFDDYLKNHRTDLKTPNRKVIALKITFQMMLNLFSKSEEMIDILNSKDRINAGKTANPEGLYLKNVFY